jgi:hypothetical protein
MGRRDPPDVSPDRIPRASSPQPLPLSGFPLNRWWWRFTTYRLVHEPSGTVVFGMGGPEEFELPPEILPMVVEREFSHDEAVLQFVRQYGLLSVTYKQLIGALGDVEPAPILDPEEPITGWGEAVTDFRAGASALQALFALHQELHEEDGRWSQLRLRRTWLEGTPWPVPHERREGFELLLYELRRGLQNVTIDLAATEGMRVLPQAELREGALLTPVMSLRASLYSRCILELANQVLSGQQYRRCLRDGCGRAFSERREDAKYCSERCATLVAKAEYRRRKRQSRSGRQRPHSTRGGK